MFFCRVLVSLLFLLSLVSLCSQDLDSLKATDSIKTEVFSDLSSAKDTSDRLISRAQILLLKKGAIVVRLKTNERSLEQYRKAGKNEIADRIESENLNRNKLIMTAFKSHFRFCKVYFIYAKNTKQFLEGKPGVFLNDNLQVDTSIRPKEKFVLLAEYGTVMSNVVQDEYHFKELNKTSESNQPAASSAIFLSDLTLTQLKEPFPFFVVVYLDKYSKGIERWSNSLERYYQKVINKKDNFLSEFALKLMSFPHYTMPYNPYPDPNFYRPVVPLFNR